MALTPTMLACVALAATLTALLVWTLIRQAALGASAEQHNRQLREQLGDSGRQLAELGRELAAARADARTEAERGRATAAELQTSHLATLQKQVTDMAGFTQQQLEQVRASMSERFNVLNGTVGEQLTSHNKVIMEVKGQLGGLQEAAKNMQALGQDINSLQDILRAPKLRGNLGELFLEEILRQVLPGEAFEMQYRLPDGDKGTYVTVDAVIRLNDRLVPIDSKFPLESFQRLLENAADDEERAKNRKLFLKVVRDHIDAIADKYIRPDAGTYDFALAYLPAENVYYEAVVRDHDVDGVRGVVEHAAKRKVIPVSPNSLYAYLLTIAYGLKGLRIERQAEALLTQLAAFQKKFVRFYEDHEKVGRTLDVAKKHYDNAHHRATKLHDQVGKMTGVAMDLEGQVEPVLELATVSSQARLFPAEGAD